MPAQRYALKFMRYMHEHGIGREAMRALAMASYHHAQSNPRAVMHGRPLTEEMYDQSRWISEPYRLFDCCQENDGAAALILVSAERAKDFRHKPAYVLAVAQGSDHRNAARSFNAPDFASSSFGPVAPHLWEMAKLGPGDVDVLQSYENFTGGVLMSMAEHGFFKPEEANEFLTLENLLAPSGKLPLNTSGGNLAECYMHGLELQIEAVRQIRGQSTAAGARRACRLRDRRSDGDACIHDDRRLAGDPVMSLPAARTSRAGHGKRRARPALLGRNAAGRAEGAALRRLQHLAMGPGMALPSLPVMGHALGSGGGPRPHLDLDSLLASGASGAERPRPLYRRAR